MIDDLCTDLAGVLARSRPADRPVIFAFVNDTETSVSVRERVHAIGRERLTLALRGDVAEMTRQLAAKPERSERKRGVVIDADDLTAHGGDLQQVFDLLLGRDLITLVIAGSASRGLCASTTGWLTRDVCVDFARSQVTTQDDKQTLVSLAQDSSVTDGRWGL